MALAPRDQTCNFLSRLAERRCRENDLSDVTWAPCHAVPRFAVAFAQFVGVAPVPGTVPHIQREVDLGGGSRVDMTCAVQCASGASETTAFIEIKLYDRNYHLSQYSERVAGRPGSRLVLLTNHVLEQEQRIVAHESGWQVLSWRDLVDHVQKALGPDEPLVEAYLGYVRRVCNMVEVRDIRFDPASLYSLVSLDVVIEEVIGGASHDDFAYSRYKCSRDHGQGWTGAYFRLQRRSNAQQQVFGLFGLLFEEPHSICLAVWLDRDWNAPLLEAAGAAMEKMVLPGLFWLNNDGLGIAAPDDMLRRLLQLPLAGQRELMTSLFRETLYPIEHQLAKLVVPMQQANPPLQPTGSAGG